jgi:molybdate transport system substrate-binding protein
MHSSTQQQRRNTQRSKRFASNLVRRISRSVWSTAYSAAFLCVFHAVNLGAAQVTVFAASSLTDSLKEIAAAYQHKTEDKIIFNFAASSVLARQIEEGAPADIFFSADEAKMDAVEAKGLVEKGTRASPLSNLLVVVTPRENSVEIKSVQDLTNSPIGRIALADPKTVPIGIYARQFLEKAGLWEPVQRKVVIVENVRAALATVEAGNADAAFVYKTDAAISKKVRIALEIPRQDGPNISYSVALIAKAPHPLPAGQFLDYLTGAEGQKVFQKFGFITQPRTPNK